MAIATHIACMECGGQAQLVQPPGDEDVVEVGDVLVYRCPDCMQRWDVVVDEEDLAEPDQA